MSDVGLVSAKTFFVPGANLEITYNPETIIFTWIIIFLIVLLAAIAKRALGRAHSKTFTVLESLYTSFLHMAQDGMGPAGRKFTPFIVTIFIFVLLCNWIGVIPGLQSPTKDLNTCLGLGILVFIVAHFSAIMKKGFWKYLKAYCEPFFLFLPLNIIGEAGKLISHSFRLFGNIFAGAIIFALTGPVILKTFSAIGLPEYSASPVILAAFLISQAFFGLFVGTVQALVFALLALTYIAILQE